MAGHLGAARITVQTIQVARVDQENNLLYLRGAVPGPNGGYLVVEKSGH
jgi:large subunit ribosomal protein L3